MKGSTIMKSIRKILPVEGRRDLSSFPLQKLTYIESFEAASRHSPTITAVTSIMVTVIVACYYVNTIESRIIMLQTQTDEKFKTTDEKFKTTDEKILSVIKTTDEKIKTTDEKILSVDKTTDEKISKAKAMASLQSTENYMKYGHSEEYKSLWVTRPATKEDSTPTKE